MGKAALKPVTGEVAQKDFAGAVRAYRNDIKPAVSKIGEFAQEVSTATKHVKKNCHIQPAAFKFACKVAEMEEAKRDDLLRGLNGMLKEFGIFMPRDMVDIAEGKPVESVIPAAETPKPKLVTVGNPDDSDLAEAAE